MGTPKPVLIRVLHTEPPPIPALIISAPQEAFLGQMQEWKTAEGVSAEVPYKDNQNEIIADLVGGLRSGLTYAGANTITELQRKLNYVIVTPAGRIESLPHKLFEG